MVKILNLILFLSFSLFVNSQNFLDNYPWIEGNASTEGFNAVSPALNSTRKNMKNPFNNLDLIWEVDPKTHLNNENGGWFTNKFFIYPLNGYRFTVWAKKVNSDTGNIEFGAGSDPRDGILTLDGSVDYSPLFFDGNLPQLNKWYLLVGYIHGKNHISTTSYGGIYDPVTGYKVASLTDYKFTGTQLTSVRHRTSLSHDTNEEDKLYLYAPRLEAMSGAPTIAELLGNISSSIEFSNDVAKNQIKRILCIGNDCNKNNLAKRLNKNEIAELIEKEKLIDNEQEVADKISIYPNPTQGRLTFTWPASLNGSIKEIKIIDMMSNQRIISFDANISNTQVDLSHETPGIYVIQFLLKNGRTITKKIIKN